MPDCNRSGKDRKYKGYHWREINMVASYTSTVELNNKSKVLLGNLTASQSSLNQRRGSHID